MADADVLDLSVGPPGLPRVEAGPAGPQMPPEPDPGAAPTAAAAGESAALIDPEATARSALQLVGSLANLLAGEKDPPADVPGANELWQFSEDELDRISPALARWAGRNARMADLLGRSDEAVVIFGLGTYAIRNVRVKGQIRERRQPPEPRTGLRTPTPGGAGPGSAIPVRSLPADPRIAAGEPGVRPGGGWHRGNAGGVPEAGD